MNTEAADLAVHQVILVNLDIIVQLILAAIVLRVEQSVALGV